MVIQNAPEVYRWRRNIYSSPPKRFEGVQGYDRLSYHLAKAHIAQTGIRAHAVTERPWFPDLLPPTPTLRQRFSLGSIRRAFSREPVELSKPEIIQTLAGGYELMLIDSTEVSLEFRDWLNTFCAYFDPDDELKSARFLSFYRFFSSDLQIPLFLSQAYFVGSDDRLYMFFRKELETSTVGNFETLADTLITLNEKGDRIVERAGLYLDHGLRMLVACGLTPPNVPPRIYINTTISS